MSLKNLAFIQQCLWCYYNAHLEVLEDLVESRGGDVQDPGGCGTVPRSKII